LNGAATDTRSITIQTYIAGFQNLKLSLGMALSLLVMAVSLAVSAIYVLRVYRETRFE
jgi:multiple sugar transport system permease protein